MPRVISVNNPELGDWLQITAKTLDSSGVIGFPTDTYYGLGANPFDPTAIEKIFEIKSREKNKPILLLIGDTQQLFSIVEEVSPVAETLMMVFWPGPITLLFEAKIVCQKVYWEMEKPLELGIQVVIFRLGYLVQLGGRLLLPVLI